MRRHSEGQSFDDGFKEAYVLRGPIHVAMSWEFKMTAFNVVRFRVKRGREQEFLDAHKAAKRGFPGMRRVSVIKTGEGTFCIVGEWSSFEKIVAARPNMIATLDTFRNCLEDLGGGLGVTDPVAGVAVLELSGSNKPSRRAKHAKRTATKKGVAKAARKTSKRKKAKKK
jgi:hypothetical protein